MPEEEAEGVVPEEEAEVVVEEEEEEAELVVVVEEGISDVTAAVVDVVPSTSAV